MIQRSGCGKNHLRRAKAGLLLGCHLFEIMMLGGKGVKVSGKWVAMGALAASAWMGLFDHLLEKQKLQPHRVGKPDQAQSEIGSPRD